MYKLLLLAALLGCVLAAPAPGPETTITKFLSTQDNGQYAYTAEQSDGTSTAEEGSGGQYAKGRYSYISPEGIPVDVSYVADEFGFHPESNLLPTPPPVPDYILRALEFIEQHPTPEELADREVRKTQI